MTSTPAVRLPLSESAARVRSLAAERAAAGEAARRLDQEVLDAIVAAGFARHFVPARWGGHEGSLASAGEAIALVGEGCASAAWIASVFAYSGRFAALLPEQAQAEVWADGPDRIVASALVPVGTADEVPGGWRVSGTWLYISGAGEAGWALVCGPAPAGPKQPLKVFAVPRADYTVEDTWHSTGMRATMSNTLVLDDVFVPEHRVFPHATLLGGASDPARPACHRTPMRAAGGLTFGMPIVGAATAALRASTAAQAAKQERSGKPDRPAQLELTRAAAEIDTARRTLEQVAEQCDQGRFSRLERSRYPRDAALAVELAATAVDRLVRLGGTAGFADDTPIQRIWRDVTCASTHHAVRMATAAPAFAAALLDGGGR